MSSRRLGFLHRLAGICAVLPLLLLVITGVPLQFSDQLGLGQVGVYMRWVHSAYSVSAPEMGLAVADIQQVDELIFDANRVVTVRGELVGAQAIPLATIAVTSEELWLLPEDLGTAGERNELPYTAQRFAFVAPQSLLLDTTAGVFSSEDFGTTWQPNPTATPSWQSVRQQQVTPDLQLRFGAHFVRWERWLQDLHSGRFFGALGEWIMSLASLAVILLSVTGLIAWFRGGGER